MKMQDIKGIAQSLAIPARRMNKAELVRAIQSKEGNTECFETGAASRCGQDQCLWRPDCK
jgi:DNA-binding IscR family transcriptional regulator